jgi:uncharacterized protein YndB with AHSA1/START domain
MTEPFRHQPDPKLDLVLERVVDVPPEAVWAAWTRPEQVVQWFTPAPWKTVDCEIDLRPGGIFRTTMRSPEGDEFPNAGCILEVVENRRFAWTGALAPGFRPVNRDPEAPFSFTGVVTLEPHEGGTRYTALVMHSDEAGRASHEQMGFHQGWGAALDQLVEMVKRG